MPAVPDLNGWEAYCEECGCFREARRVDNRDLRFGSQYYEFICNTCHSVLLSFQALGTEAEEKKPPRPQATARCPHCQELNVFPGFAEIFIYVCQHCGRSVDATPPIQ
jgi:hypothetical protein